MPRYAYQSHYVDGNGTIIPSGTVTVKLTGTDTLATVYSTATTTSAITNSQITTDSDDGSFKFFVDTKDYDSDQEFRVVLSKTNFQTTTYDNISIFPDLVYRYQADPNETDQGATGNGFSIKALIDDIGSNNETIYLRPGSYTMTTNETLPANITLKPADGAVIDGAATFTINGCIEANPSQKIFGSSITVDGTPKIDGAWVDWFGTNTTPGTTDMTTAIQAATDLMKAGGKVKYLLAKYLISDEISFYSGTIHEGQGRGDAYFGDPQANTASTFIYQDTAAKACYSLDTSTADQITDWVFKDMAMSGLATPSTVSVSADKIGLDLKVETAHVIQRGVIERVTFYNFNKAINVIDVTAGTGTDASASAVNVKDTVFFGNTYGTYYDTVNADVWKYDTCSWYLAANQTGVYSDRSGFMTFINCNAGGWVATSNQWLHILSAKTNHKHDNIKVINCQAETLTYMLYMSSDETDSVEMTFRTIEFNSCVVEANIEFESGCHFVSINNQYADTITVTGAADYTQVDSILDRALDGGSNNVFVISGTGSNINTMISPFYYNVLDDGATVFPYGHYTLSGRQEFVATAKPSSGTFATRDIAWINAPALTSVAGWICSAGGSPGTWIPIEFGRATATTAQLEDISHAINTTDKYQGRIVLNTTTSVMLYAGGSTAGSHWYTMAGVDTHTPA